MLTLTLCTAALFLLAQIGLVLVAVGLPFAVLFLHCFPGAAAGGGESCCFGPAPHTPAGRTDPARTGELFLLGLALLYH